MSGRSAVFVNARIVRRRFRPAVCALFLLEPAQEGRVEGFGPVQVAVGGHRVETTEQVPRRWAAPR